jgi:hypothetical protein
MVKILKILSISNAGETAKKVHHSYIVEIWKGSHTVVKKQTGVKKLKKTKLANLNHGINTKRYKRWTNYTEKFRLISENYAEWKHLISKYYTLYNSIYITFLKWQKL